MESLLITTGYLLLLFGLYLLFTNWNEDPIIKGAAALVLGIFLMGMGFILSRKREEKKGRKKRYEIA